MDFNDKNRYFAGYKEARANRVPLTELYAVAYSTYASDFSMTLAETQELEVYINHLKEAIICEVMLQAGYDFKKNDDDTYVYYKR